MIRTSFWVAILTLTRLGSLALAANPEFVEPTDLARRPELVGREVVVDDRIRYFLESKRGQGYDELLLRRTEVMVKLPGRLKFPRSPSEPNARILGILKAEDGQLVLIASAVELLPADMDRLEKEVVKLRPDDFGGRRKWALWAERRGKELIDPKLEARGVVLEGEALWLEADRPDADNLALATRNRSRPIAESVRNALAHRGFRDRLTRSTTSEELDALAQQIELTLPDSTDPKSSAVADSSWTEAYVKDAARGYRDAPDPIRSSFDRRLLGDVIQRSLEVQVAAKPDAASGLAEKAKSLLPDRPELADRLRQRGLGEAESRVSTMRLSEVEDLARTFREQGQDERGRRLVVNWLADRRKNRLSATDAEGRILLASHYDKLLADRATAGELLREAQGIDPESRTVIDSFLRMGFRKGDSGWYDPEVSRPTLEATPATTSKVMSSGVGDSMRGLTRTQVRSRLGGKPDQVVRIASQSRCVEQWIYKSGKGMQVVNFLFEPGNPDPRVASYYSDSK